jgi:O-antigen/teichoic acid export membrane protein
MSESKNQNTIRQSNSSVIEGSSNVTAGYRSIFKATSIFGGVQVFNIIISIIRAKVLAVLLGTAGMGLNGLLMSGLDMVRKVSGLGISESAVRDISDANSSNNTQKIRITYTAFKRLIWLTAIIGVVLTISLSPLLSKIAFGDKSQTVAFIFLSVTFVFGALTGGIYTLLRGIRKIKLLAKANIMGSTAGLLVAIPIFYFFGIKGIIPAIIATAVVTFLVSLFFRKKVEIKTTVITTKETFSIGRQMIALGITLTAASLFTSGITFILNAYISKTGSLGDLGLYNAGHSIMAGYVGMIFTAMSTDYYPRLSGVINKPKEWHSVVNQQSETVILILGPILAFILLSAPLLIKILLSSEFLPVLDYLVWASLAVILKAISWAAGFILISKADNKLFLYVQMAAMIWSLGFNILFFNFMGVKGLGISTIINQLLSLALMYVVLKVRYKFVISRSAYMFAGSYLLLLTGTVIAISILDYPNAYPFAAITFIAIFIISIRGLNRRMDLIEYLKKMRNRNV